MIQEAQEKVMLAVSQNSHRNQGADAYNTGHDPHDPFAAVFQVLHRRTKKRAAARVFFFRFFHRLRHQTVRCSF